MVCTREYRLYASSTYGRIRDLNLYSRMASILSITQNFRQLTLTLPADSVMVDIHIKTLKGQYTYSLNNNYTDLSFTPWSEDHEPSESFQKLLGKYRLNLTCII